MRRRKKPGAKEKLLSHELHLCKEPEKYRGNWQEYFLEKHPIHVELGTGRGQFITTLASKYPEINFIGIEIKEEILLKAVEKANDQGLRNVTFLWYDVNKLGEVFAEGELSRIYINFCDPWPKTRMAKRRLTHKNFIERYKKLMGEQGSIYFKTDNEKLFEFSLNEFADCDLLLRNITFDLHHSDIKENTTTEYEDKFAAMGMKIYRCEAGKRS